MSRLTNEEKIILKNTPEKYKYIARDESGELYLHTEKPEKRGEIYMSRRFTILRLFDHLFKNIKWEDDEPYKFR